MTAISRDTSNAPEAIASGTSLTISDYINAGKLLVVFIYEESADDVTGVTFNGDAMTYSHKTHMCYSSGENTHTFLCYYLVNPDIATGDIVVTRSSSTGHMEAGAVSYLGDGVPDSTSSFIDGIVGDCEGGATLISGTHITATADSWIVGFARFDNGGTVTGTGEYTKLVQGSSGEPANEAIFDTDGAIATAGSKTIGLTSASSGSAIAMISLGFAIPIPTIKTIDGKAIALVKTADTVT